MELTELVGLISNASFPTLVVLTGWALAKEIIIIGKYHRQMMADRDKTISDQAQKITQLEEHERSAREMAWRATDIGKYLVEMQKEKKATE